jgi:hypothetical protein
MASTSSSEAHWNSTASEMAPEQAAPRAAGEERTGAAFDSSEENRFSRPGSASDTHGWLGEWTWTEVSIMLVATIMPLLLLATLGVSVSRSEWYRSLTAGAAPQEPPTADKEKPAPKPAAEEPTTLGQPAPGDPEMKYEGKGRAHLGDYSVKIYDPDTCTTFRTDFALEGETTCENPQVFQQWMAAHHCLFREQVMVTVRNGQLPEFSDRKLSSLSRKLVAQVNRAVGEPFLKSVRFTGFRLYESVQNSEFVLWEEANDDSP